MSKRVVITGTGAVASIGGSTQEVYESLTGGVSSMARADFGPMNVPAALIPESGGKRRRRLGNRIARQAFREALEQARIRPGDSFYDGISIVAGTMNSTFNDIVRNYEALKGGDWSPFLRQTSLDLRFNSVADDLSRAFGLSGERVTITNTCATGLSIIGRAKELIQSGECEVCVSVGVDLVNIVSLLPLYVLRIIDQDMIKPFDLHRKGTALGDGAGALVLESLEHALERQAPILAEVRGISIKNDIFDTYFSSSKDGLAIIEAMREAIDMSGIQAGEIGYINAHGTGTPVNDQVETNAVKTVFGEQAYDIPVNSTKSLIGHTGAAAGILEVIAGMLAIQAGVIHPTLRYGTPDPECDLNYAPNQALHRRVDHFLTNSIGFGGVNASAVISRYRGGCHE